MQELRECSHCGKSKCCSEFYRKRSSYEGFCKMCKQEKHKAKVASDPDLYARKHKKQVEYLTMNDEARERREAYLSTYYSRTKEHHAKVCREWWDNNKQRMASDGILAKQSAKYRAKKKLATPSWIADELQELWIVEIYHLAKLRGALLGVELHVDHIVPLQSDLVCGLHCPANLQLLEPSKNSSKGNRLWPDMP